MCVPRNGAIGQVLLLRSSSDGAGSNRASVGVMLLPLQTSADLKGYMEGAGTDVAEIVAARMAELANAVFPMSPMERQPTKLAMLGDRGVSLRGAEVRNSASEIASEYLYICCLLEGGP